MRQEALKELVAALQDDDLERFQYLQTIVDELNESMHEDLRGIASDNLRGITDKKDELSSEQAEISAPKFVDVDNLPLGSSVRSSLKQSHKEIEGENFTITLSYQGIETSRMVNDNMPVILLYRMAKS